MKKVYISKSIHVKDNSEYFISALDYLDSIGVNYDYWIQGTPYDSCSLHNSDAVIFLANVGSHKGFMGKGSFTELATALNNNNPIFLLYQLIGTNTWQIYDMSFAKYSNIDYNRYAQYIFKGNTTGAFKKQYGTNINHKPYVEIRQDPVNISLDIQNKSLLILRRRK